MRRQTATAHRRLTRQEVARLYNANRRARSATLFAVPSRERPAWELLSPSERARAEVFVRAGHDHAGDGTPPPAPRAPSKATPHTTAPRPRARATHRTHRKVEKGGSAEDGPSGPPRRAIHLALVPGAGEVEGAAYSLAESIIEEIFNERLTQKNAAPTALTAGTARKG